MKEYTGLTKLRSPSSSRVYCPKCGNHLEVVNNGWFHGELFFCRKEQKVFAVQLKEITKKAGDKFIEQCNKDLKLDDIRFKVYRDNVDKVEEFIKNLKIEK